ncbi:hypothetical protein SAMN04488498_12017 [Mesorhizobium albiziae]|uniref:Glycosyl hydrolases family 43 n=1 Tax=Neomesorhizobium albiziae TaxID=335020 RepID=A0A1I4DUH5_9HYPH|nr:hypothetical protein [Mesorhizobium albiziae]GLS32778.1 hypothetical protein GCM10007937_44880 [Mesorhizobium albiziae]SFK97272.1 hypothetical protein SAMN04488498_12017 [Mesorhizobium albiziae]
MHAVRLGHVFSAEQGPSWMRSHATYAAPVSLDKSRARVFIVTRDDENRGLVGWVDVALDDPRRILAVSDRPCLMPGALGAFDDRGISIGSANRIGSELWLYYMGWNTAVDVPFRNAIGLAISKDGRGESFERIFQGPLLDRSRFDPFTISYPFVIPGAGRKNWIMYYGSSRSGSNRGETMDHVITSATSVDGIDWRPTGLEEIGLEEGEYGLSRPWVFCISGRTFMLYSIRCENYTIGLAEQRESGRRWLRLSSNLLTGSAEAWESEATCYPAVLAWGDRLYLFYSGNGYGRTGFGVAVLKTDRNRPLRIPAS